VSTSRAFALLLAACGSATAPVASPIEPTKPEVRDERFVAVIQKAAADYQSWGRVDEAPNIAPELCRMPTRADYGRISHVRQSLAPEGPHGTKLYYLWASPKVGYLALDRIDAIERGFTVVKQSFVATKTAPPRAAVISGARIEEPVGWIETDHGRLFTGEPAGLYVMTKVGGDGTDAGWVYGTVSAAGEVTSAGRVASCMGCHEAATHERLFGLQPTKELVGPGGSPRW
jgi:hypothetical protein